jgi:hypothetical protein
LEDKSSGERIIVGSLDITLGQNSDVLTNLRPYKEIQDCNDDFKENFYKQKGIKC